MKRREKPTSNNMNPTYPDPTKTTTTIPNNTTTTTSSGGSSSSSTVTGGGSGRKGKMAVWGEEEGGAMDGLLAALGYKVKSSDMAQVANKLQQLEEFMCSVQEDGLLSQLASDTVFYNPSDLSSCLESLISEFNPNPNLENPFLLQVDDPNTLTPPPTATVTNPNPNQNQGMFSDYDLKPITGSPLLHHNHNDNEQMKRVKYSNHMNTTSSSRPVVVVDTQENGIRLVHLLMACAEAVQENNLSLAEALVKQIGYLAVSQTGAMRKVATYFAEALARRIYGLYKSSSIDHSVSDLLQMHFYETCPYLKFAHFTANQAILEAFEGKKRVHVIDFSMNQGMQWPALMQALALRPGGPPAFRLTGIGPPSYDNSDHLQEVGWKLAQLAETIHVEFEYRGFVANSLADLDACILELRPVEAVAVNSIFELHKLLSRSGAVEKVLSVVKQMKPEIVTVVEQEASHNSPAFLDRFNESLHYYSALFDSLEGSANSSQDKVMSEVYLGKQICNVVACEGPDRVERHETLAQWRNRFSTAGFHPAHLGSNAFKQASMLLALFAGGDGYRVEENDGCLMLGWHTRPLIATSAWRLSD